MTARLPLTLAVGRYDRVQALFDGRVRPDGIDLTCLALRGEESFFGMLRHREFEVAKMSLSSYVLSHLTPERPFVAILVFPSRVFGHSSVYANADSGIERPRALRGKVVGALEYHITAEAEPDYYAATQTFRIMHTVVLPRKVHERHPWVAQTLTQAFAAAQRDTYERLSDTTALATMLPWAVVELECAREFMGHDFWPYGVEANRTTLSTFLRYSHEQHLTGQLLAPEELFARESLEGHAI